jgi:uncharacterized OB-fold protein
MTSTSIEYRRPTPIVTADNAFYWEGAAAGELRIQACGSCGALAHPPSPLCPVCHSPDRVTKQLSGRGRIASYIIVHHPPNPWFEMPIAVVTVELEDGPTVTSNIVELPLDAVEIGLEVEVLFASTDDPSLGVPLFKPVEEQE